MNYICQPLLDTLRKLKPTYNIDSPKPDATPAIIYITHPINLRMLFVEICADHLKIFANDELITELNESLYSNTYAPKITINYEDPEMVTKILNHIDNL